MLVKHIIILLLTRLILIVATLLPLPVPEPYSRFCSGAARPL